LKVFPDAPTTSMILRMLRNTFGEYGSCRFLVTDHGCQFRRRFKDAIKNAFGVALVKGRVRACAMNGKVERFFRTLRWWENIKLMFDSRRSIQKKLDVFRRWYNAVRPMWVLGMKTPEEAWAGLDLERPTLIAEADSVKPAVSVERGRFEGDPLLPVIRIELTVRKGRRRAAA
jgi:hypothetical protein